jgi:hypothetical protein
MIVRDALGAQGVGYLMVPMLPVDKNESNSKTRILSALVLFTKNP